jgi:hypothetical protein
MLEFQPNAFLSAIVLLTAVLPTVGYTEDLCAKGFIRPFEEHAQLQFSEIEGLTISLDTDCNIRSRCTYDFLFQNHGPTEKILSDLSVSDICNTMTRTVSTGINPEYDLDDGIIYPYQYRTITAYYIESGNTFLLIEKSSFHSGQEGLVTGLFEGDTSAGGIFLLGVSSVEVRVGGKFD